MSFQKNSQHILVLRERATGCNLFDNVHVFCRVFTPNAAFVLVKADVQNPMYVVFNSPMLGHV